MRNYMNTNRVAKILGVNVQTVRHYIRKGELRAARVGKRYVVTQDDIDEFLERRKEARDLGSIGLTQKGQDKVLELRVNSTRIAAYLEECPGGDVDEIAESLEIEADDALRALRRLEGKGMAYCEPNGEEADRLKDPWYLTAPGGD